MSRVDVLWNTGLTRNGSVYEPPRARLAPIAAFNVSGAKSPSAQVVLCSGEAVDAFFKCCKIPLIAEGCLRKLELMRHAHKLVDRAL